MRALHTDAGEQKGRLDVVDVANLADSRRRVDYRKQV
jgi:hypothetical protein